MQHQHLQDLDREIVERIRRVVHDAAAQGACPKCTSELLLGWGSAVLVSLGGRQVAGRWLRAFVKDVESGKFEKAMKEAGLSIFGSP